MRIGQDFTNDGAYQAQFVRKTRPSPAPRLAMEQALWERWSAFHDIFAARQLADSHLYIVEDAVEEYRQYQLPLESMMGEGCIGLMRAVCRFDPSRGMRFAAHAELWVRATLQYYVLCNWSLTGVGATAARENLSLDLRRTILGVRDFWR